MQPHVSLLKKSPFTILAASNINDGYSYRFCFECKVGTNNFHYKPLIVTAWSSKNKERKVKNCSANIKSVDSMGLMEVEFSELMNTNFTLQKFMS